MVVVEVEAGGEEDLPPQAWLHPLLLHLQVLAWALLFPFLSRHLSSKCLQFSFRYSFLWPAGHADQRQGPQLPGEGRLIGRAF